MIRTQISFTEDQMRRLRTEAERRGVSMATLVREAVDKALDEDVTRHAELWERAMAAVGSHRSGEPNSVSVAVDHDRYLAEVYAEKLNRRPSVHDQT